MKSKIGFVSLQGSPGHDKESTVPSPDLSGKGWEYWYKTKLTPNLPNNRGDGVLRLRGSSFVRVVWDADSGLERCTFATTEGSGPTAYLEFSRPISTTAELHEQISRAVSEIEAQ